jgi:hypothetical protein
MPKRLARIVRDHLEKARESALAAVEAYNKPGSRFRTAQYIVLINMAWTALFHAIFFKRGRRPWHRKKTPKGVRYLYVDGEPKHWELATCVNEYYQDANPPERANLGFLAGLRHKIEHRHLPELDPVVYGECQAALTNLEELLTREFGARYALGETLAVSLQFSRAVPAEKAAAMRLQLASAGKDVLQFIDAFRAELSDEIVNDPRYSFRVYLVPKATGRPGAADVAVEFVPYDPNAPGEMEQLRRVVTLIKERQVPVANLELLRARQVVDRVRAALHVPFNMGTHTLAWRHYGVRPPGRSDRPERTKPRYCVYDKAHADYLYTPEWVDFLVKQLSDPAEYERLTRKKPPAPAA